MAVTIVHRLEPVEIDIDQCGAGAVAFDIGQRALELAFEAAAIKGVGQRIDVDARFKILDAGAGILELRRQRIDLRSKPHNDGA